MKRNRSGRPKNINTLKSSISVTLNLRWVSPTDCLKDYLEGATKNIRLDNVKKQEKQTFSITKEVISKSHNEEKFYIQTKSGNKLLVVSKKPNPSSMLSCCYCHHTSDKKQNLIVTSYTSKEYTKLVPVISHSIVEPDLVFVGMKTVLIERIEEFHVSHASCDFNCAYSDLTANHYKYPPEALQNTILLHSYLYPGMELEGAKDMELLDINGGQMSYVEYKESDTKKYFKMFGFVPDENDETEENIGKTKIIIRNSRTSHTCFE